MKIIRFGDIPQVPAAHEDPKNPSVLKKVLFRLGDLASGKIQMVNWATILPNRSFSLHHHESMQEIFIMLGDGVVAGVDGKEIVLSRGDALVVEAKESHEMKNIGVFPVDYLAVGIV